MSTWVAFTNIQGHFDHWKYTDDLDCSYGIGDAYNDNYSVAVVKDRYQWEVYVPNRRLGTPERIAHIDKTQPLEIVLTKAIELAVVHRLTN